MDYFGIIYAAIMSLSYLLSVILMIVVGGFLIYQISKCIAVKIFRSKTAHCVLDE